MTTRLAERGVIGRARTVLVVPSAGRAFVSAVLAVPSAALGDGRLRVYGRIGTDAEASAHVEAVVLPAVDRILEAVNISIPAWDVVFEGLDAMAAHDTQAMQGGHSADLSLYFTLVSSALDLPLRQDVIFTGALTSCHGTVGAVGSLPAKIRAAREQCDVREFVYPAFRDDGSLKALAPAEAEKIDDALIQGREQFHATPVQDIAEALPLAIEECDIPLALLGKGLFGRPVPLCEPDSPTGRAVKYLLYRQAERFWSALATALQWSDDAGVSTLLESFLDHHRRQGRYPAGTGKRLHHLLMGLAPLRRRSLRFPLVDFGQCLAVGLLGTAEDSVDVTILLEAIQGRRPADAELHAEAASSAHSGQGEYGAEADTVGLILHRLSPEYLARHVGRPIDEARDSFHPGEVTTDSRDEFVDALVSFYVHLLGRVGVTLDTSNRTAVEAEALAFADEAYARAGGLVAAEREAVLGLHGGLRNVLDTMADHRKQRDFEKHVQLTFATAMKGPDDAARAGFVRAVFDRFGPLLPADIRETPVERFVPRWEELARATARCLNDMTQALRRL